MFLRLKNHNNQTMIHIHEERDDNSTCTNTCDNDNCGLGCCREATSSPSSHQLPTAPENQDHNHSQPMLRVLVDAVPSIPSFELDSVSSQVTVTSCCEPSLDQLAFRCFTEPPLRRRRPLSYYEDDSDVSEHSTGRHSRHSSSDSIETWHTAVTPSMNKNAVEPAAASMLLRPRFPPRFLLRPRRFLHHHGASATTQQHPRRLIPSDHPLKLLWDLLTVLLSFAHAYATHQSIRDREFVKNGLIRFCEVWFMLDILLNFFTERHVEGRHLTDLKSVWARYLTSWFVVDVLALVPFELLFVQPIIELQNRRGFFRKSFFRTKAVVRVTRIVLKRGYIQLFGRAARQTRTFGIGANRLLKLIIKYLPKYLLFLRNMKAIVAVRVLRQANMLRKVYHNWKRSDPTTTIPAVTTAADDNTSKNSTAPDGLLEDDDITFDSLLEYRRRLYYNNDWEELVEEEDHDDDGDPY